MRKELKCKSRIESHGTTIHFGLDEVFEERLPQFLEQSPSRVAIITDTEVYQHYRSKLDYLEASVFTFPAGEKFKSRESKAELEDHLLTHNFGRNTTLIGLGGGVVGDLCGFLAATYLRGVSHIHIPTTLLAMIDAAIGGKTAINTPYGKNTIGAFHFPTEIWVDGNFLQTLPERQMKNGLVELIKTALVDSPVLFGMMKNHASNWEKHDPDFMMQRIFEALSIKKAICEKDPEEKNGLRRILNFGHTFGHALEALERYQLQHGEAVAVGILTASYMSWQLGLLDPLLFEEIQSIFTEYQIPLTIHRKYDVEEFMKVFARDKKSDKGIPRFVLLESIGKVAPFDGEYCTEVEFAKLEEAIHWMHEQFYRPT